MEQYNEQYNARNNPESQPQQPLHQQMSGEKILRKGTMILSLIAMVTSYIAVFKRIFKK